VPHARQPDLPKRAGVPPATTWLVQPEWSLACFGIVRQWTRGAAAKIPRLGYLVLAPLTETPSPERAAFLAGLRELGWIEGKTIAIEYRSANWNPELLDDLGEELARTKVDIIVAVGGGPVVRAAKRATSTIPIVMTGSADPVAEGLVASMARPGGNVTGMSSMIRELGSKRLELLKETVPRVARLAVLLDPVTSYKLELAATQAAARRLGVTLKIADVGAPTTCCMCSLRSKRNGPTPSRCSST